MKQFYEQKKLQVLSKLGTYAIERFGNSQYARTSLNSIPLSLLASLLKGTVSFLLLFRLQTNYYAINFIISMMVTVVCAFISPVFYLVAREHEKDLLTFSNHVADRLIQPGGILYLIKLRNIAVLSISAFVIVFCLFVDVTSWYIINTIIEFLIGFWVVDQVNQFRESLFLPVPIEVVITNNPIVFPHQLTVYDYEKTGRLRQVKVVASPIEKQISSLTFAKAKRAKKTTREEILRNFDLKMKAKTAKMAGATLLLMDDWENI